MSCAVIESPLAGDFQNNFRFLLWCCRAVWLKENIQAIASHMLCPWFMDDHVEEERMAGIFWEWVWRPEIPHMFFIDLGMSNGMSLSKKACLDKSITCLELKLQDYSPECWLAYCNGEWPPHTKGFELKD